MPESGNKGGRSIEVKTSGDFLKRLNPVDVPAVVKIVDVIATLADVYHKSYYFYPEYDDTPGFFGVFGIGGTVTKQGERPDIDLLIVTNADLTHSYKPSRHQLSRKRSNPDLDWLAFLIHDDLSKLGYRMDVLNPIPDEYTLEDDPDSDMRAMLRLIPITDEALIEEGSTRKSIDIVYIQTHLDLQKGIHTLLDFEDKDVDEHGEEYPRVSLFQRDGLGVNMSR